MTALHQAARSGHQQIVLLLLEHGAHIESKTFSSGSTTLHYAATKILVRILFGNRAYVNSPTRYGITPLITAAKYNRKEAVRLVLDNGAMISADDDGGQTALDWAQIPHCKAAVRLLESRGPALTDWTKFVAIAKRETAQEITQT